jgi:hypothetical protein
MENQQFIKVTDLQKFEPSLTVGGFRHLQFCNDPVNNCTCYSCSKNGAYEYDERTRNQTLDS